MKVMGINGGLHDSSACLVVDGRIVAFSQEERHTRIKHDGNYPRQSVDRCLKEAGLRPTDIEAVAYSWDFFKYEVDKLVFHIDKALTLSETSPEIGLEYLKRQRDRKKALYEKYRGIERETRARFECPFICVDHHVAHAYSTFPLSGFDASAVLITDGSGEKLSTSMWHHRDRNLKFLRSYEIPHSLGIYYAAITQFLGFLHHDEEWKVMGWAPYGTPRFYSALKKVLSPDTLEMDLKYFQHQDGRFPWYSEELVRALGVPPRPKEGGFEGVYADVAASAQLLLEDCVVKVARDIRQLTGERNLCMAGGVALNGKANGRILDEGIFENLFVQPASADDGTAIGAALKVAWERGDNVFHRLQSVYFGSSFTRSDCAAALKEKGLSFTEVPDPELARLVAGYLADGKVVGFFQGRSELGPRALGDRSILADPRRSEMKDVLNRKIKFREPFRPFAPSVSAESAGEYFEGNISHAYFMNQIFKVKKEKWDVIPAVTHADRTARIQIVTPESNPRYYALIRAFGEKTGVPVIINTSFNVKGEPMVDSPRDAVNCFLNTGIDVLVLENYVTIKSA